MPQSTALAGFAPHELGVRSTIAFCQMSYWVAEGYCCYPAHGDTALAGTKAAATTDFALLRRLYDDDPSTDWRVRALPEDGLIAIHFPRARDFELLERELCKLPRTRTIERDGGARYQLFARAVASPEFAFGRDVCATRAQMKDSVPVAGSIHRPTGQRWRWRDGCGIDISLAYLPRQWLTALPKRGANITARITERPEWRAHTPRWNGN